VKRRFWVVASLLVAWISLNSPAVAQYAAPAAGPAAATTGNYIVVTAPEADVLADPRGDAAVILKVLKGDLLPLRGQAGEWYSVGAGEGAGGWIRRSSAALLMHPEFLDPVQLRESYTPPPYVPPSAGYGSGWWGGIRPPWRDPLWWGLWYYDQKHDDDDDDHHDHRGGHNGHNDDDHDGSRQRDRDRDRDRDRSPRPNQPVPPPPRDPRVR
jgi:hypothetical protein